jgi:hypothetical protein
MEVSKTEVIETPNVQMRKCLAFKLTQSSILST